MSRFSQLPNIFIEQWAAQGANIPVEIRRGNLEQDGQFYYLYLNYNTAARWRCSPLAGNSLVIVTSDVYLRPSLRGLGIGKFLDNFRRQCYTLAGYKMNLGTVRDDNVAQIAVKSKNSLRIALWGSDYGGSVSMWVTPLDNAGGSLVLPRSTQLDFAFSTKPAYIGVLNNLEDSVASY